MKWVLFTAVSFGGAAFDQLTKYLVFRWVGDGGSVEVIPGILSLSCAFNTGAAFGMFRGYNLLLSAVTVTAIVTVVVFCLRNHDTLGKRDVFFCALIAAGAVGNLLDRIVFGSVRDFMDVHFWPVFNLADVMISLGVVGMVVFSWRGGKDVVREE